MKKMMIALFACVSLSATGSDTTTKTDYSNMTVEEILSFEIEAMHSAEAASLDGETNELARGNRRGGGNRGGIGRGGRRGGRNTGGIGRGDRRGGRNTGGIGRGDRRGGRDNGGWDRRGRRGGRDNGGWDRRGRRGGRDNGDWDRRGRRSRRAVCVARDRSGYRFVGRGRSTRMAARRALRNCARRSCRVVRCR